VTVERATSPFVRTRPRSRAGDPAGALALLRAVLDDGRAAELRPLARFALAIAAARWASDDGCFYVKHATWARELGVSTRQLRREVEAAREAGVLAVQPYLRPGGGGQGANSYQITSRPLLAATDAVADPLDAVEHDDAGTVDPFLAAVAAAAERSADEDLRSRFAGAPDEWRAAASSYVCTRGRSPLGLLGTLLDDGERDGWRVEAHWLEDGSGVAADLRAQARRVVRSVTGCRLNRAGHGVPDPLGVDRPQAGWPHARPTVDAVTQALRAQRLVLDALGTDPLDAAEVARATGLDPAIVRLRLRALVADGLVVQDGDAGYSRVVARVDADEGEAPVDLTALERIATRGTRVVSSEGWISL
jgi:predicted ArsR family transcriptional regulator